MLVLHLSHTPLVGAPGRICKGLRAAAGIDARWCVLEETVGMYRSMSFDLDLVWKRDREQVLDLAERCDVLHLHNYINLESREFSPIDFGDLARRGKSIVRHFHSTPDLIARFTGKTVEEVLACPIPKLVIAQYPERYFPSAKLVPNFPGESPVRGASGTGPRKIGYAPSRFGSGRKSRWDTKGYPETVRVLRNARRAAVRSGNPCDIELIEMVSHDECMRRKALCDIFVDDLVTGSYHLNTLEALAMGIPCLDYIDGRTQHALFELTGRDDFPVVNVALEHATGTLLALLSDHELISAIGKRSAEWVGEHWNTETLCRHFVDAYHWVRENPGKAFPLRFDSDDPYARWVSVDQFDLQWKQRHSSWPRLAPDWLIKARTSASRLLKVCRAPSGNAKS